MRKTLVLATVATCLLTMGYAWAAPRSFDDYDRDQSGVIERDEFPHSPGRFDRMDTNKDGLLSPEEFETGQEDRGSRDRSGRQNRGGGHQGTPPPNMLVSLFDSDKDGSVTKEELLSVFEKLDGDGDGRVSDEESRAYMLRAMLLGRFDSDGDGSIAQGEVDERMWERLSRADADGDGVVSPDEMDGMGQPGRQRGQGGERGERGGGGGGDPARMVQNMDKDGDGQLSRDEWRGPEQAFDHIDANADGFITSEELESGRSNRPPR